MKKIAILSDDLILIETLEKRFKKLGISQINRLSKSTAKENNIDEIDVIFIEKKYLQNGYNKNLLRSCKLIIAVGNFENNGFFDNYNDASLFPIIFSDIPDETKIQSFVEIMTIMKKLDLKKEKENTLKINYDKLNELDELAFIIDTEGNILNCSLKAAIEFKIVSKLKKKTNIFQHFNFESDFNNIKKIKAELSKGKFIEISYKKNFVENKYFIKELICISHDMFLILIGEHKEKANNVKGSIYLENQLKSNSPLIFVVDLYGNLKRCNDNFSQFIGLEKEQIQNLNLYESEFFDSENKRKIFNILNRLKNGEAYVLDILKIASGDNILIGEVSCCPYNLDNEIYYIFIYNIIENDDDEIKSYFNANRNKYQIISENLPIGSFIYQDGIKYANNYFYDFTGYSKEEICELSLESLFESEICEILNSVYKNENNSFSNSLQTVIKDKNGKIKDILLAYNKISLISKQALILSFVDIGDKTKAQEALRRNEIRQSLALELLGYYTWEYAPNSRSFLFSDNWKNICNKDINSFEDWLQLFSENHREKIIREINELLNGVKKQSTLEISLVAGDDIKRLKLKLAKIACDSSNLDEIKIFCVCSDITDEKTLEEKERLWNYQFKMVWESSLDAMRLMDENGIVVDVNDAFCKIFEIDRKNIIGKPFTTCYSKSDEYKLEAFKKNFEKNSLFEIRECRIFLWNGKEKVFSVSNSIFSMPDGEKRILSVFRDITRFREIENKVKAQESKLSRYFHLSKDGILALDKDGVILEANEAALKILKYEKEQLIGQNILNLISLNRKSDNKLIEYYFQFKNNREITIELDIRLANSHSFSAEIDAIETEEEEYIIIIRDISEKRKNEKKLETYMNELKRSAADLEIKNIELQKLNAQLKDSEERLKKLIETKDKFFSIVAHDLKNPFNALLGYVDALSDGFDDMSKEEIKTFVDGIKSSSHNIYSLLENLLSWSRIQLGKFNVNIEMTNLKEISEKIINLLRSSAEYKNIRLINEIKKEIRLYTDKNIVFSVLQNLTNNAIKFTKAGGFVKISAEINNNFVVVSVKDNGMGMTQTLLNNIFDLKKSVSTLGTKNEAGTGLGLSLCKEMLAKIGGDIWAESELGKGSTFYFKVPLILKPL